ncbi:MAG: deoxyribodipyrimidine photo-lyase [Burkholderiaceae bacterium]|jgi:deoxyribodipyrimidine photo-lyase
MNICWFRTDLRVHDNTALTAAVSQGATRGLFIASPGQWQDHNDAPVKIDFWRRALLALQTQLAQRGIPLDVLVVDHWAQVPQALLRYCQTHQAQAVYCNREHGANERTRDRASFRLLKENGIALTGSNDDTLLPVGSVKTGSGDTYRVFTPFAKQCRQQLRGANLAPLPAPSADSAAALAASPLNFPAPDHSALPHDRESRWPADEAHAQQRLHAFVHERAHRYHETRDFPDQPGTSALSPYLAAGVLSVRQCLHAALTANHGELDSGAKGITVWITELLWREFYRHLMHGFPDLSKGRAMKPETEAVPWRSDAGQLQAWQQGRTGIPIVDAGMRQLVHTGWMHNRVRMITAMFLTKNLLIDWRVGEAFFMQHLVDGDFASNNGGWQWSASTGADAAPYFRIFNPVSQSQKFDPRGDYIRHWVPELGKLDARTLHDPSPAERRQTGYPEPIVDLKTSRQRAIDAFASL